MNINPVSVYGNTNNFKQQINFGQGKIRLGGVDFEYLCGFWGSNCSDIKADEFVKQWEKRLPDNSHVDFYRKASNEDHIHYIYMGSDAQGKKADGSVKLYHKDIWEKNQNKINECLEKCLKTFTTDKK